MAAVAVWIGWTVAMTARDRVPPGTAPVAAGPATTRDAVLLAVVLLPFIPYVFGVLRYDWGFNELSALFLIAGFAVGLFAGRSLSDTAAGFLKGMEGMLAAALFVGVARAISVVLSDGQVLDTSSTRWRRPWPSPGPGCGDLDGPDACAAPRARAVGQRSSRADNAGDGAAL